MLIFKIKRQVFIFIDENLPHFNCFKKYKTKKKQSLKLIFILKHFLLF